MVFFLVGTNIKGGNKGKTWQEIEDSALRTGGSVNGLGHQIALERERFKLGNLDMLMHIIDIINKMETSTEGLIKRIEKQYFDLDEKKEGLALNIETITGPIDIGKYILTFKWDDSKFARNKALPEIIKMLQNKIDDVDRGFRQIVTNYVEVKTTYATLNKREGGNFLTKDLNEVLSIKGVKASDFIYSDYLTTLVAIVPKNNIEEWEKSYEFICDNVVPRSTKKFPVEDKDYTLWRVILFKTQVQEFVRLARDKHKVTVKEFKFDEEYIKNKEKDKQTTITQFEQLTTKLLRVCKSSFSEAFICFMHLKMLKLLVDCGMRFGVNEQYLSCVIDAQLGKEKNIVKGLLKIFGDPSQIGLYGSKEELQESEDFYPFVYIPISLT